MSLFGLLFKLNRYDSHGGLSSAAGWFVSHPLGDYLKAIELERDLPVISKTGFLIRYLNVENTSVYDTLSLLSILRFGFKVGREDSRSLLLPEQQHNHGPAFSFLFIFTKWTFVLKMQLNDWYQGRQIHILLDPLTWDPTDEPAN